MIQKSYKDGKILNYQSGFITWKKFLRILPPHTFFKWLPAEVLKFCTTGRLQALKWASWILGPIPDWSLLFMGHDWWTTSKFVSKIRGLEMFFRSTRKYNLVNSYRETYHVWKIVSVVDFSFDVNRDEQSNCFYTLKLWGLRGHLSGYVRW